MTQQLQPATTSIGKTVADPVIHQAANKTDAIICAVTAAIFATLAIACVVGSVVFFATGVGAVSVSVALAAMALFLTSMAILNAADAQRYLHLQTPDAVPTKERHRCEEYSRFISAKV